MEDERSQGLLVNARPISNQGEAGEGLWDEIKRHGIIAAPMIAVNLSLYFLQIIAVTMVGHLGELALSSTAIAISFGAVTGLSPAYGMSCALETLCGQAYGAREYRRFGVQIYTAIFSLILVCIPISIIWLFMGRLLVFFGQDPEISYEAGKFIAYLIPALFAYATLQPIIRYYQTQSLIMPMLVSSCVTISFHVIICWVMVYKSRWGTIGGALAIGLSYWLNVLMLGMYMKYSSSCAKTRVKVSLEDISSSMREFFGFAIPSAVMVCLEWWSFELLTILSGLMKNPKLETSVLSMCLATLATLYTIPESIGAAASTRISNELGAGNPRAAHRAVVAALLLTLTETIMMSSAIYASKCIYGYIFSNEEEVVEYFARMAPLVCVSIVLDSLHGVLSGIARGCGWQDIGAYINLAAYYICGIPVAAMLGFWANMRGKGLWMGIIVGSFVQTVLLLIVTLCTNWEEQANKARARIFKGDCRKDVVT